MRDDFNRAAKELLAKQAGHRCAHPHCGKPTSGADESGTGAINIGVAAHITAASAGGPRYAPALTSEQRKDASNGIWLCQDHAHAVDADDSGFSAEILRIWKRQAEDRSFHALMAGMAGASQMRGLQIDPGEGIDIRHRFNLAVDEDLVALKASLVAAAREDAAAFRRTRYWTEHAIELKLRLKGDADADSFSVHDLATTTEAFNEIVILSPPGTGKTTTLLQLAEAIINKRGAVASFLPLDDWSAQSHSLFESILERQAFRPYRQEHLRLLAHTGELTLVLDGWNQLDGASRRRARNELEGLRRDYPKLGIVISSRNLSVAVPFATTVVAIEPLDHAQQRQVASEMRGADGETLLEEARAIPGLRELVSVPLFLNAILRLSPGSRLPTTKEGVLAAFVEQHNQVANRSEALRDATLGHEQQILADLAAAATRTANTSLPDGNARASVQATQRRLADEGQISAYSAPQPMTVLEALIAEHLLVRSSGTPAGYSFQHQQFQEWYASFAVEHAMRNMAAGDATAAEQLAIAFLDVRPWEESILFACERMASGTSADLDAVAKTIVRCLSIDPMLAAEIIFRAPAAWGRVEHEVTGFLRRWHQPDKVDRAIGFIVNSGRPEFAELLWPLLADSEHRHHLDVLRAGRRFPPSLLPDMETRLATLEESTRAEVLGEMVSHGGMEGALFAASVAQTDSSVHLKKEVVESLYWCGADQQAARVLQDAPLELWQELASGHPLTGIHNTAVTTRMAAERRVAFESMQNPGHKLHFVLNGDVDGIETEQEVFTLLADPALEVRASAADHALYQAHERYPSIVASALVRRIEQGLEIPFRANLLVQEQHIVTDEDPIRSMVNNAALDEKIRTNAASIAGPVSIGRLIDAQLELDAPAASDPVARRPLAEQQRFLGGLVITAPYSSLVAAVLARADTTDPRRIALFAELLASHRGQDSAIRPPAILEEEQKTQLVDTLLRWVPIMVDTSDSTRAELAELARAIGTVGDTRLAMALDRLLSEDLRRWDISRAALVASGYRDQTSDARHSWTNWYQRAFIAIGTEQVKNLLVQRLSHPQFGAEGASALMQLWEQRHPVTTPSTFPRTFLREMTVRRGRRLRERPPAPEALAILDTVTSLLDGGSENEQLHAIRLAVAAFRMPCGDISALVRRLIEIPAPLNLQRDLYVALALSGERLQVDAIQSCIRALFAESETKPWVLGDHHSAFFGWVELLAFSERPAAILDEVAALEQPHLKQPYQMRGLLSALGASAEPDVEDVLLQFAALIPGLAQQHEWLAALSTRGTDSSGRALLQLLRDGAFDDPGYRDIEALRAHLAQLAKNHIEFRADMLGLLEHLDKGILASAIERALLMLSDTESILSLVRYYARTGRSGDGLYISIRKIAMDERPSAQFSGAVTLFPVPVDDLRRRLFSLALTQTSEAGVARQCLALIDGIRDDYGYPESEARHPDIRSGQPWPLLAPAA
ncbi:ATP-binding protein [Xanthomonas arboricola]|uniref:ATP-binding protein n=1 Tax=Xanthomonas arboricola TaxID=56448 RepID=UPI0006ACC0D6|nr:ATP-binding protein [Xanthomonas arboricola]